MKDSPRMYLIKEIRNYDVAFTHSASNVTILTSSTGIICMDSSTIGPCELIFVAKGSMLTYLCAHGQRRISQFGFVLMGRCYLEDIVKGEAIPQCNTWQYLDLY